MTDSDSTISRGHQKLILWVAAIVTLIWLALAAAGILVLLENRAATDIDLLSWAALIAATSAPLALIGICTMVAIRFDAQRDASLAGRAQLLFEDTNDSLRSEIAELRDAILSMRSDIQANGQELEQQGLKLLSTSEHFSQKISDTTHQLSGEAATLESHAQRLDQAAAGARVDLGAIMADLPRLETMVETISGAFRTAGGEAAGQTKQLEDGLARLEAQTNAMQHVILSASEQLNLRISDIEQASERSRAKLETLAGELSNTVDDVLARTAHAMEASSAGVNAQGDALLLTVNTARETLNSAGADALERLQQGCTDLLTRFQQVETVVSTQDSNVRSLIAHLGAGMVELESQLVALGRAGEAQTTLLSQSVHSLRGDLSDLSEPLSRNEDDTNRLIDRMAELRTTLGEIEMLSSGELAENLVAAGDVVASTRSALADTEADISRLTERLEYLRDTTDVVKDSASTSAVVLDNSLTSAIEGVDSLKQRLETTRDQLQAIENQAGDVGLNASTTLLDALSRARDAAAQAADHVRTVFESVSAEMGSSLARSNEEVLRETIDGAITSRIAALKTASEEATSAAQSAAERLAGQLLTIAETTASIEARISETNEQVQNHNQEEFSRRSALLIESLNSTAIDIARILSSDISDIAWSAYLKGDRSVFSRRAVRLLDSTEVREVLSHYENDDDFRDQVNRYIHDFEAVIRRILSERDSGPLAVAMLSSDVGKLYVALAQAINRLRAN